MRVVALLGAIVLLAGCVTTSNTVPPEQISEMRLVEVNVSFADGAQVTPEVRSAFGPKMKSAMEQNLSPLLKGANPVRVDVQIKSVTVASDVQRVLVGGHHGMTADVTLVDIKTKSVIVAYPALSVSAMAGQGVGGALLDRALLSDPVDRIADRFAFQYSGWLKPSGPRT